MIINLNQFGKFKVEPKIQSNWLDPATGFARL